MQLYATKSEASAQKFAAEIEPLFGEEVNIEFNAPYYRVRIGNCTTVDEAWILQQKAAERGYDAAWIVAAGT